MMQQREDSKPAVTHAAKQAIEYSWQQGCLPFAKEFAFCRMRICIPAYPSAVSHLYGRFMRMLEGGIPRYE